MGYICPRLRPQSLNIFFSTKVSGSEVVLCATTHPQPLPCQKNLGFNKNHPSILPITEGSYTPYLNSRHNIQGGNVLIYLDSRTPCEWVKEFLPLLESSGYIPHVPHPITFQVTHLSTYLKNYLTNYLSKYPHLNLVFSDHIFTIYYNCLKHFQNS